MGVEPVRHTAPPQILSSRKTRIKTLPPPDHIDRADILRYYPPEKQGLRQPQPFPHAYLHDFSDTILQKNKD